jgi:hypothetical protein
MEHAAAEADGARFRGWRSRFAIDHDLPLPATEDLADTAQADPERIRECRDHRASRLVAHRTRLATLHAAADVTCSLRSRAWDEGRS